MKIGPGPTKRWRLAEAAGFGLGGVLGGPVGAALLGAGATALTNVWSARRADSAHQREVRDLRKAGLNPVLSAMHGSGAQVGNFQDIGQGAGSALAVQRQRAELKVLAAAARREAASAKLAETQANEISSYAPGRAEEVAARAELTGVSAQQARIQRDKLVEVLESEISQRLSSAKASDALSALHRADLTRAENIAEFEKSLGQVSPAMRMIFEALRALAPYARR